MPNRLGSASDIKYLKYLEAEERNAKTPDHKRKSYRREVEERRAARTLKKGKHRAEVPVVNSGPIRYS